MKMSNEGCREQACECCDRGDYLQAMRWYNSAYARTIGHKKRDRYEQLARECAEKGDFEYRGTDYAKDSESEQIVCRFCSGVGTLGVGFDCDRCEGTGVN